MGHDDSSVSVRSKFAPAYDDFIASHPHWVRITPDFVFQLIDLPIACGNWEHIFGGKYSVEVEIKTSAESTDNIVTGGWNSVERELSPVSVSSVKL